jgi:putative transcription antitermination factor YqgF
MSGRIMALDVGEKRVGVALSDETQTLARSLTVLQRRSKAQDFEALAGLARQHQVSAILVGLPRWPPAAWTCRSSFTTKACPPSPPLEP